MGKSKGIEKIKFKLRAKGRHGTHSPFVYAFVEEVLRNKEIFPNCPQGMFLKEWNFLNATLSHIRPLKIFVADAFLDIKESFLNSTFLKNVTFVSSLEEIGVDDDIFVVASAQSLTEIKSWLDFRVGEKGRLCMYLLSPHTVPFSEKLRWAMNIPEFKMVLDFWDAMMLVQSADFKEKQFFELK